MSYDNVAQDYSASTLFQRQYDFPLDDFQLAAIAELDRDRSVLVAAPTGTGKTLVAEYAIYRAFTAGRRVFYTTPIKALSNQKYRDLSARYGNAVGLLTGDVVVQPTATALIDRTTGALTITPDSDPLVDAGHPPTATRPPERRSPGGQVVVMTTEVLRNMLLQNPARQNPARQNPAQSTSETASQTSEVGARELADVEYVIFDEIHYMADPARGTTWEEAIICCPAHVKFVCLSATVANAAEIADWIGEVHGQTALVYHDQRAVPLDSYYFLDNELRLAVDSSGRRVGRFPGLGGDARRPVRGRGRHNSRPTKSAHREAGPDEVVQALRRRDLLPAIYFLFSRRDVELAAEACLRLHLGQPAQREQLDRLIDERIGHLSDEDRELRQVMLLLRLLPAGIGYHHAGMLPVLKALVEEAFGAGLLGVVFATDTLSLGINMPARSVVVGGFTKYDGESRRMLTSNEYRQLTGRAGRRGIDGLGTAVVPYSSWVVADDAFAIASGPLQPVESAFLVRYNTVLSLWEAAEDAEPGERLVHLLSSSLREFQLDGQLRGLRARAAKLAEVERLEDFGCPTCTPAGLAELDWQRHALPHARKELERAERAEAVLLEELEVRPWRPSKPAARRLIHGFGGGEPLHHETHGWGLFLSRPTSAADGSVALALFGRAARLIHTYSEIDYLPDLDTSSEPAAGASDTGASSSLDSNDGESGYGRVALPDALSQTGPVEDVELLLLDGGDSRARIAAGMVALRLPNIEALSARYREARRAELAPRLAEAHRRVEQARGARDDLEAMIAANPCRTCPNRPAHQDLVRRAAEAAVQRQEIEGEIARLSQLRRTRTRQVLRSIQQVLERFGHLRRRTASADRSARPGLGTVDITPRGEALRDVFDANGLIICEALERGDFDDCSPAELAEALSWFAYDRDQTFTNRLVLNRRLVELRDRLEGIEADVLRAEAEAGLRLTPGFGRAFSGAALAWCQGATFEEILDQMALAEGDVMLTFNKTLDLMRQVRDMLRRHTPGSPILRRLATADRLMRRGIVEQGCRLVGPVAE